MATRKIVVVTGANRGIGRAICDEILLHHSPVTLYACSRAGHNLELGDPDGVSEVRYPKLDIMVDSQIHDLVSHIRSATGRVDVLINNAAMGESGTLDATQATNLIQTNYYGTLNMCKAFLPIMPQRGRIVNVSSAGSSLQGYPEAIQDKFRDPQLTMSEVDAMIEGYLAAYASGRRADWGNKQAYSFSKACMNAMTRILAKASPGLLVNCCCPGWVATDMGRIVGKPPKTPAQGSKIPVRLGLGEIENISGHFWSNPSISDTADGQVVAW